jgi:hypothetical protein
MRIISAFADGDVAMIFRREMTGPEKSIPHNIFSGC